MNNDELRKKIEITIDEYVENFSNHYHISKEEARSYAIVKIVKNYYEKGQNV